MTAPARAARAYAERLGWHVLPCNGKLPLTDHGHLDASNDLEVIAALWRDAPSANVGIRCDASGFFALDIDPRHDGEETLLALEYDNGELPNTTTQFTGGGGQHLLFKTPADFAPPGKLGAGIDVKWRGYIIAAPSIHPETRRPYAWSVDHHPLDVAPAEPPLWLIEMLRRPAPVNCGAAFAVSEQVAEGTRNVETARVAGHLLRRYVDIGLARTLVHAWNAHCCVPPLDAAEIDKVFGSVCGAELRRRERAA